MTDAPLAAPPKTLQLGETQLLMSYAMLMDINRWLPDPVAALQLVMNDPTTQDYIVRRLLTPKEITVTSMDDLIAPGEVELDTDQIETLLSWAVQHALYFFAKRSGGLQKVGEAFKLALPTPSSSGSEASASTEPSAGPSAA